jgi:formyltetrahydrofolate deformylase
MQTAWCLTASCPDKPGIVARVSGFIADHGGTIVEASYHSDQVTGWFFMRHEIEPQTLPIGMEDFVSQFEAIAVEFGMQWQLNDSAQPKRVVLMASRESHCLADLLHRQHSGDMNFTVPCVISNHESLREMVEWFGVPFVHMPVSPDTRAEDLGRTVALFDEYRADVVVLARYMQILPPEACRQWFGRVINIHHSFLPSFAGARPYHQAYDRGVKLIGSTCHYVTDVLDAGPIIEQDTVRVSHRDTVQRLVRMGRDIEKNTLARGLRYHLEDRVLIHGNKTIIFD